MDLVVRQADLADIADCEAVLAMTRCYARDPMSGAGDLSPFAREHLVPNLRRHPCAFVFLAFDADEAVGIATCFLGFSTFAARPLMNIHDLAVAPAHRGQGVSRALAEAVEAKARELDCCKITLEVYAANHHARDVYQRMGFTGSRSQPGAETYFCTKDLTARP